MGKNSYSSQAVSYSRRQFANVQPEIRAEEYINFYQDFYPCNSNLRLFFSVQTKIHPNSPLQFTNQYLNTLTYSNNLMQPSTLLLLCLLWVPLLSRHPDPKQITSKSILLPISEVPHPHNIQYVIEAFGGCYRWSTTGPEVLQIKALPTGNQSCQSKALVQLKHVGPYQSPLHISAQDINTNEIIKADVRLSRIASISITTKFSIMNVNQVQEFYVTGYDSQKNSFSSLEGFKFEWTIIQSEKVVERVTIRESEIYQQTNYRKELQSLNNYQTDMFVLRAIKIGQLKLRVRLAEAKYEHISTEVDLAVQERFEIVPDTVDMLAGSRLKFNLVDDKYNNISLPNSIYKHEIGKEFKASKQLEIEAPAFETQTRLVVSDYRTAPAFSSEAHINVYKADALIVDASDFLVVGTPSQYRVQFYSKGKLLQGDVLTDISTDLQIDRASSTVLARKKGESVIQAKYNNLKAQKIVTAQLPLKAVLLSDNIVLPEQQIFPLKVVGGSNSFIFQSSSDEIAEVTSQGIIRAKKLGQSTIRVTDRKNPANRLSVNVTVETVVRTKSLEDRKEVLVNQETDLIMIAQPVSSRAFTLCSSLEFSLDQNYALKPVFSNNKVYEVVEGLRNEAKSNRFLEELLRRNNHYKISVQEALAQFQDYIQSNEVTSNDVRKVLSALMNYGICGALRVKGSEAREQSISIRIQNYKNAIPIHFKVRSMSELSTVTWLGAQTFYLTPRSSMIWKTKGGPQPWDEPTNKFVNNQRIDFNSETRVKCGDRVERIDNLLKTINPASIQLPRPVSSSVMMSVYCQYPSQIKLTDKNGSLASHELYLTSREPFTLGLVALSDTQQPFYNYSNLDYRWTTSGVRKVSQSPSESEFKFEVFNPQDTTLNRVIRVQTNQISESVLTFPKISDEIRIFQKNSFKILSAVDRKDVVSTVLFLYPNSRRVYSLAEGSGYFTSLCISEVVRCEIDNMNLNIIPLKEGHAIVSIIDTRSYGRQVKEIDVKVVKPAHLQITANTTSSEVDRPMSFRYQLTGALASEKDDDGLFGLDLRLLNDCGCTGSIYEVTCPNQGLCTFSAMISNLGMPNITSNRVKVEVFSRFVPNLPRVKQYVTNIPINEAQIGIVHKCQSLLTFIGGSERISSVKLEVVEGSENIKINQLNFRTYELEGQRKGKSTVVFRLQHDGKDISKTVLYVEVEAISGVSITGSALDTRRIHNGATVRLLPEIMIGRTRAIDLICSLTYEWKVSNTKVLKVGRLGQAAEHFSNVGLNITGVERGAAEIELTVRKDKEVVGKAITRVEVVDYPNVLTGSYVGQPLISTNFLLLGEKTGYTVPIEYSVQIVQNSDTIEVRDNTIWSTAARGSALVELKNRESPSVVMPLAIHSTKLHSLLIQNPFGVIEVQRDSELKVRFYLMDSFGRLFPNNLVKVDYNVQVTNASNLKAWISEDKNYIVLRGAEPGQSKVFLSVQGMDIYDEVPVHTGLLLSPSGQVSVHVGGIVQFSAKESRRGTWSTESNILTIDPQSGLATAMQEGETNVVFTDGGVLKSRVNVFRIAKIERMVSELRLVFTPQSKQKRLYFALLDQNGDEIPSAESSNNAINHNLKTECSVSSEWFTVISSRQSVNGKERLVCIIKQSGISRSQMPSTLVVGLNIRSSKLDSFFIRDSFEYPVNLEFRMKKSDTKVNLVKGQTKKILIQTGEQLYIEEDPKPNVPSSWWYTQYLSEKGIQEIVLDSRNILDPLKTTLRINNKSTKQVEKIEVSFDPYSSGTNLWRASVRWTDLFMLMIVLVLLVFICGNLCPTSKLKRF